MEGMSSTQRQRFSHDDLPIDNVWLLMTLMGAVLKRKFPNVSTISDINLYQWLSVTQSRPLGTICHKSWFSDPVKF